MVIVSVNTIPCATMPLGKRTDCGCARFAGLEVEQCTDLNSVVDVRRDAINAAVNKHSTTTVCYIMWL